MSNTSTCQYCDGEVAWGQTEQGFRGFVHLATGLAACTTSTTTPATTAQDVLADVPPGYCFGRGVEMRSFAYRCAEDVTPGVDYIWLPWTVRRGTVTMPAEYVKVLSITRYADSPRVTLTLERPNGRTAEHTCDQHDMVTLFYRAAMIADEAVR